MVNFIIRRLFYGFFVLFGVIVVVFLLFNVLPGDPARMMLGQRADVSSIQAIKRELGLDRPLPVQFLMYLNDLSPVSIHEKNDKKSVLFLSDEKYSPYLTLTPLSANKVMVLKEPYLRRSYQTKRKVSEVITESLPETAVLATTAIIFAVIVGVALGITAAIRKSTPVDHFSIVFSVIGMAAPSFFTGIIIAWIFGYLLCDYTGLNMAGSLYKIDPFEGEVLELKNLILPAFTLGIRPLTVIVQLTRSSMLDVLTQDYIRTARSKGLSQHIIIVKHGLKNALNPVITAVSSWFASMLAGAVFVEYIFGWKGIGKELFDALEKYDFPLAMGITLVIAIFFILINILVDIAYGLTDPRVRVQ
ncbi:MAG: ABC transporter permease [Bacteroidetes bacterium]|nr:ABC transporter permease [Bacteroidota bacterium]